MQEKNMTTIVTGQFSQAEDAERALSRLIEAGFLLGDTSSFPVDPLAVSPRSAPPNESAADRAEETMGSGAAVGAIGGTGVGLALGAVSAIGTTILGPGGLLLGAAIGAYAGSLVGALVGQSDAVTDDKPQPAAATASEAATATAAASAAAVAAPSAAAAEAATPTTHTDTLIAVRAPEPAQQLSATNVLREAGAAHIESVQGDLRDGKWSDFDPIAHAASINA